MHVVPKLQLHMFTCQQWTKGSTPVMPCHEGDQLVVLNDLHLTSYSTLLHVLMLAANYLVLSQGHFHEMDQLEEHFLIESVRLSTLYLV